MIPCFNHFFFLLHPVALSCRSVFFDFLCYCQNDSFPQWSLWVFIFRKSWHQIIYCFFRLWATSLGHKDIVWAFVYVFTGTKSDDGGWSNERCKHLKSCSNGADPHACTNLSSEWRPKVSGFSAFSFFIFNKY